MSQGRIVEYIDQGKIICSLCMQDKGGKLHLLTTSNREVNLSSKRALLISDTTIDVSRSREELIEHLKKTEAIRKALKEEVDAKELWELVQGEAESFDNRYLAELCFGEPVTDHHVSALVRALFEDRLHFRLKDGRFLANTEERVEQILRQREEEALREERLSKGSEWIKKAINGQPVEEPEVKDYVIKVLKDLALFGKEAPLITDGKELLARAGISRIEEARNILVSLGIWDEDENLDLIRFNIPSDFTEEEKKEASSLALFTPSEKSVEDLTHLPVVTIDGPFTRDYDDALSIEEKGNIIELGIHIADVASIVRPGTALDNGAAAKPSSLYLPRRQIPMIPPELSENTLSLREGKERKSVSLICRMTRSGDILDYRFTLAQIRVTKNLVYGAVNGTLEDDPSLSEMFRLARLLRQRREERGALNLSLPEVQVVIDEQGNISTFLLDQGTPSRMIVAELMILYNWLAGRFCRDNQIPALYRTQAEPSERLSQEAMDYLLYVFLQRRRIYPLLLDTSPGPHSGLGLDAYAQVSSPIRRYLDLVVQRQIREYLFSGKALYSKEQLDQIRIAVEPALRTLTRIKRNRLRYWILKLLSRNLGQKFKAMVLDDIRSKYRIVLTDFLMTADIKKVEGVLLGQGHYIWVEVKKADPWTDTLVLEYAGRTDE
ncbi:MAG: RNB domain-containing ribonuclease [Deltaproteobacteria bacterium]|nr:RNB domain-containing ribonuclease [Deltaproteobacteria bacterium]MBW2081800.1 RNB domain-containing ribonuclease [Deltaproteobacteria bacterium]